MRVRERERGRDVKVSMRGCFLPHSPCSSISPLAGFVLSILACAWKHPSAQRVGFCRLRFMQLRKKTCQEREGILLDVPDNQFLIFLAKEQPEGEIYHSAVGKLERYCTYRRREEAQGTERDKVGHLLVAPLQGRKSSEQMFWEHYIKVKHVPSTHTLPTCE